MSFHIKRTINIKVLLQFFVIMMMMTGVALAANHEVIIGFNAPISGAEKNVIVKNYNGILEKKFHIINAVYAKIPDTKLDSMKKNPRIKYVANNTKYKFADEYTSSWGVQYIGSQPLHIKGIEGSGINISVLDSGIDYNHEDLKNNYKGGYDFANMDPDPWDDSCTPPFFVCHGTHVSGIIAAENNNIGIVGVAPKSNIYAVKVLTWDGGGTADDIISGIEWAVGNNSNIISMSLGTFEDNIALHEAIDAAYNHGILIIASAGNTNGGGVLYPAAYENVTAVTAINQNAQRAYFSPVGPKIELAAPGVNIYSTVQGGYAYMSGTSQSAPYVTGVASLIFSTNYPDANGDGIRNNKDVRKILQDTSLDLGSSGRDDIYGYGIVDASNAVLGNSSYADISVAIDDGIDYITAGDGKIYNYTISVRNNGPGDALNVKLFDNWPNGFIRNNLIPSQGTCDTSTNFTCDLGTLKKYNEATIIARYTVPYNISLGTYTHNIQAIISNTDYNNSNNMAQDINEVKEIELNLVKRCNQQIISKKISCSIDIKSIYLDKDNYSINIYNINLIGLGILVYENNTLRIDSSKIYKLKKYEVVNTNMNINSSRLDFIPYGYKGSIGSVRIRRSG